MNKNDFEKIDSIIASHVGSFADSIQHKLDMVVDGHQMLSEKIDRVEERLDKRMDCLEHKLIAVAAETSCNTTAIRDLATETSSNTDAIRKMDVKLDVVAADITAHRRDTEAHPTIYKVKEGN